VTTLIVVSIAIGTVAGASPGVGASPSRDSELAAKMTGCLDAVYFFLHPAPSVPMSFGVSPNTGIDSDILRSHANRAFSPLVAELKVDDPFLVSDSPVTRRHVNVSQAIPACEDEVNVVRND
jgi:hypothetical protein